jgi:nuclear transport factor 2 (NTF2) superfamily protein
MVSIYGNKMTEFNENGYMKRRHTNINDLVITEAERKFYQ